MAEERAVEEGGPPEGRGALLGYARLADAPVDPRRVALVMAAVGIALSIAMGLGVEGLLASADQAPEGAARVRAAGRDAPPPARAPGRAIVLLVDGLRVDEAAGLPSLAALSEAAVRARTRLTPPTLSRPFYHRSLTGVPPEASGVRSNRFEDPARFDSVFDRVRAAGGRVYFATEGLDWMPRMHGRPGDVVEDGRDGLHAPLDRMLETFAADPGPALMLVHTVRTDSTAHEGGIDAAPHREALAMADALIARLMVVPATTLVVLSDHGHRRVGGHGGPEPEVADAPFYLRAPGLDARVRQAPIAAEVIAPLVAAWVGVSPPRSALAAAPADLAPPGYVPDPQRARVASAVRAVVAEERVRLRRWRDLGMLFALFAVVMTLGPIKRGFGFDRSIPVAILGWPLLVLGLHVLVLDRPLSLSAIDGKLEHGIRVAEIGVSAFMMTVTVAYLLARGDRTLRALRATATVGWSAASCALITSALAGFSLGPWPLSPRVFYLPLLTLGAAAPAVLLAACVLLLMRGRPPAVA